MYSINIKSSKYDYLVSIVNNCNDDLNIYRDKGNFLIIDTNVDSYNNIDHSGFNVIPVKLKEHEKTLSSCENIIQLLLSQGVQKHNTIIAVGGGVLQDVVSFVSSILYRGIDWVFVPTTLLSQADSCIGGKTSINFNSCKNILGGFYPPVNTFIDLHFLKTLPECELKSGIGEILHFLFLESDGEMLIEKLSLNYDNILSNPITIKPYIEKAHSIKKKMVEIDEFDRGSRNIFNYGHTFGHAIESLSNHEINHGQAVTLGMDLANYLSLRLNMISIDTYIKMYNLLKFNLPIFRIEDVGVYIEFLKKDKKNLNDNLGCILTEGIGQMKKVYLKFDNKLSMLIQERF